MVDFMFSVDLFTPDPIRMADRFVTALGLPPWKPSWTDLTPEQLIYLRARSRLNLSAPTLIEILSSTGHPDLYMTVPALQAQADDRPVRTHATVFVSRNFDEIVEKAKARGVRHIALPGGHGGLDRCWFGLSGLEPGSPGSVYEPEADGGLLVEVINWDGTAVSKRPAEPEDMTDGEIVRVSARTFLVADIDGTVASLRECLDWPGPDLEVTDSATDRHAFLQPAVPGSAALELVQPLVPASRYSDFFQRWGPGPHAIRIDVHSLAAKAEDLRLRGTAYDDGRSLDGDVLLAVDPSSLDGIIVEFRQAPD
jgi:hypothetical protein